MDRADIETKVIDIVSTQLGVDKTEVTLASSFANDLNADSLDTVELVMELEDSFETSIPDEQAEQIQTVGNAVDFIIDATAHGRQVTQGPQGEQGLAGKDGQDGKDGPA